MASSTITTPMTNTTEASFEDAANFHLYTGVTIFSTVFLFVITAPTLVFNGMTLFAIHKDPLKCFRNPLAMFMTGVLVADFISGLIVYPFFGAVYAHDLRVGINDSTYKVYHVAGEVLTATVTISFLTLLGLAISQLIAVNSPMRYDRWVTVRGVKTGLICIWIYAAAFISVPRFFRRGNWIDYVFLFFLISHWLSSPVYSCS
ncbi:beta-3 adrenergic receptor-like [Exaiptasia diaphana]|uniref:G-protein coupled receptors family 1 profile domain-containing protein n=1 Tax=Exaiptasia diaphana TaxID=2652724 RepID=A0A913XPT3_EXADI|nr:beta-3 adrenergic receptor-like [Exaiptasia diaphana]